MKQKCYSIFNIMFVFAFILILLGAILTNQTISFTNSKPLLLILSMLMIISLWFLLHRCISKIKNINFKLEVITVISIFALIIGIQIVFAFLLQVKPSWDFGMIYDNAVGYAKMGRQTIISGYFAMCPNNIFPLYVLAFFYRILALLHLNNFMAFGIALNIISIDVSILGMYLIVRKLTNVKTAIFLLAVTLFVSPLFLYTPIFYTDTLSMPFPIWLLYMYLNVPKDSSTIKKIIIYSLIYSILLFLGFEMKMTSIIIVIAILIEEILAKKILLNKKIYICIIAFFVTIFGVYSLINDKMLGKFNDDISLPYVHYFMMGTSKISLGNNKYAYGIFNDEDLTYTTSFNTKAEKITNDKNRLKERLKSYGVVGSIDFFYKKAIQTFGDGTYFAPEKLNRFPLKKTCLHNIFLTTGKYFSYYFYFADGVQLSLLLLLIVSGVTSFWKSDDKSNIIRVAIFGMLLFLLLWETRSRYLVNYIPILIIGAVIGFSDIYEYLERKEII